VEIQDADARVIVNYLTAEEISAIKNYGNLDNRRRGAITLAHTRRMTEKYWRERIKKEANK